MQLNIGPRLALCFVLIIVAMLVGDAIVLWQFHTVRDQAGRLNGYDQEFVAVLRVHESLLSFHDKLEALADDQDPARMAAESGPLAKSFVNETHRPKTFCVRFRPAFRRTAQSCRRSRSSRERCNRSWKRSPNWPVSEDWSAVHRRITNQVRPMEYLTSSLVEKVDHEIAEEQAQEAENIRRVQQRVFVMVPVTSILTLLIAAALGVAITRSITGPLARLVEGFEDWHAENLNIKCRYKGKTSCAHLGQVFNDTGGQLQDLYASLQNSEDRLRRVINAIPAYVWSTLPNGSVDFVNQRLSDSTGLSAEELSKVGLEFDRSPGRSGRYVNEWHNALADRGTNRERSASADSATGIPLDACSQRPVARRVRAKSSNGTARASTSKTARRGRAASPQRSLSLGGAATEPHGEFWMAGRDRRHFVVRGDVSHLRIRQFDEAFVATGARSDSSRGCAAHATTAWAGGQRWLKLRRRASVADAERRGQASARRGARLA